MRKSRIICALVAASCVAPLLAQETVIVRPKEIDDVLTNPGIGFTTLQRFNGDALNEGTGWTEGFPIIYQPFNGTLEVRNQPMTSIAYFRVYWRFLEPEEGKFNWEMIDKALRTAHDRKQALMLRVAPYGMRENKQRPEDVPDWYRKLVGPENDKKLAGKWATDPENPLYIKYFTRFVTELARRYDGHPDMELIDISIVGAWGEGEYTDRLSEPTMKALMDAYLDNFKKTPLVIQPTDRKTVQYAMSKYPNLGWRADCLGDMRGQQGRSWSHMYDAYPQEIVNQGLTNAWQKGPVALEACWVMQHWFNEHWDVDYIIEQSLKWHISSFNNKSSGVPPEWAGKVENWLKRMGYRFVLRKFTYPSVVKPLDKVAFTTWWENKGVAPCYKQFPVALRLKNASRTQVLTTDADIRQWLPGDVVYDSAVFIPADMPAGDYDLSIGVLDPQTLKPKVKLAIAGMEEDGWYKLGRISVK